MLILLLILGCKPEDTGSTEKIYAIYDTNRSEHFFDVPYPSDDLLVSGMPDLSGFPDASGDLAAGLVAGWRDRIELTAHGYGNNSAIYFRFDGPISVPEELSGSKSDPVLLIKEDGTLVPIITRFIENPNNDPFYGTNTLAIAPKLGSALGSKEKCTAIVMQSSGAYAPEIWQPSESIIATAEKAGITGNIAMATQFTTQDATGQLKELVRDLELSVRDLSWDNVTFKRVSSIEYSLGTTPSGKDATVFTATYTDGTQSENYLGFTENLETNYIDLLNNWPMAVYEATITTLNYQGLEDQPYMNPGVTHILDTDRMSGWIDFDTNGILTSVPDEEQMRITVSIPLIDGEPSQNASVLIWDHGTGGHAYNIIHRESSADDGIGLAEIFASHNVAVIGRDASLYGTRYPLIDEGYNDFLGFYNIVNLPAFRDNQRQTAIEGLLLKRFIETKLNELLPEGSVNTDRISRAGHSLGSVTSNLGIAASPSEWDAGFLSGTGGVFTHYFLDTGLIEDFDPSLYETIFGLVGADVPEKVTPAIALGAILGFEEEAYVNVDRLHPVMTLFQWIMDPSDPMAVAEDETTPITIIMGVGDHQTPNLTTNALNSVLPDSVLYECVPNGDYDPHYCLHREEAGKEILDGFLNRWLANQQ